MKPRFTRPGAIIGRVYARHQQAQVLAAVWRQEEAQVQALHKARREREDAEFWVKVEAQKQERPSNLLQSALNWWRQTRGMYTEGR